MTHTQKKAPLRSLFAKMTLQWRLTALTTLLVTVACIFMYFFISHSAVSGMDDLHDYAIHIDQNDSSPITFQVDLQAEGAYADEEYLKEALSNLIDNAVKYSKDTIDIQITSCLSGQYIQIRVRDNGIGIPLAAQRIVFDKFERVITRNEDEKKKVSGFGLGLNYVMNVAREHGGYVSVESIEGKYSEFTVSLPLPAENEEANPED